MTALRKDTETHYAIVFKTTSEAATSTIDLQKIEPIIWREILKKQNKTKTYRMPMKWPKKKAIKDKANYSKVSCLYDNWGY